MRYRSVRHLVFLAATLSLAACGEGNDTGSGDAEPVEMAGPLAPISGAAQISFTSMEHDFGHTPDYVELWHEFEFTNTGDQPLLITDMQSGCGCTVPELDKMEYEPGEAGILRVKYSPEGNGKQMQFVTVMSNCKRQPAARLGIGATLHPMSTVSLKQLNFGKARAGGGDLRDVTVKLQDGAIIQQVTCTNPNIVPRIANHDPIKNSYLIQVSIAEDAPKGSMNGIIEVEMRGVPYGETEEAIRVREIPVVAMVVGQIMIEPAQMHLGVTKRGGTFSRELMLEAPFNKPFKLIDIRVVNATEFAPTVTFEPFEAPGRVGYRVTVSGEVGSYLGQLIGNLIIRTDMEGEEIIEVSYSGAVQ